MGISLLLAGCASSPEGEPVRVEALKGTFVFTPETFHGVTIYTRPDPQRMHAKHPQKWKRSLEPESDRSALVTSILREIDPSVVRGPLTTDQELWTQVRKTWDWCIRNMRQDTSELRRLQQANPGGATLHDHAVVWKQKGYIPTGTCGSVSNLFLQMLLQAGVPSDRVAFVQCTYPHPTRPGTTASHAYVILFVNDAWFYLDPNARMSNRELPEPVTELRSVGYPERMGMEYRWPFDIAFAQPHPFGGRLPLVRE